MRGTTALLPLSLGAFLRRIAAQLSTNRNIMRIREFRKGDPWVGTVPLTNHRSIWHARGAVTLHLIPWCVVSSHTWLGARAYPYLILIIFKLEEQLLIQTFKEEVTSLKSKSYGSSSADYERFADLTGLVLSARNILLFLFFTYQQFWLVILFLPVLVL